MSNLFALSFRDFWTKKIILWSFLPLIAVLVIFFTLFIIGGGSLLESVKTGLETGNYGFIEQYKILAWFLHLGVVHWLMTVLFYSFGFILVIVFSVIIALIVAGLLTPIITAEIDARHYQFNIQPKAYYLTVIKDMSWVLLKFAGDFIRRLFGKGKRNITDEALQFILDWTRRVTYYTQRLCHALYANGKKTIDLAEVKSACNQLLKENESVYLQYRQMMTDKQWKYLIAVAKEESVRQITAADFLKRYQIGGASASRQMAETLTEKGLLNAEISLEGITYSVSDVFFSHWLERI